MSIEALFTPFKIRNITLRSRFVMSPMQKHRPPDLIPGKVQEDYYRERVRGGIGLIVTQGTTMDHPTSESPYARLFPPAYESWKRCAETVREEGGVVFMQLWHEGAQREGGYGPSGRTSAGRVNGHTLNRPQLSELIETYANSAAKAKELGYSGVELHCGHGYLLGQFLGEASNVRADDYGGSFENRMRFPLEAVRAVRDAVGPDFPIGLRTSIWDGRDGTARPFNKPEDLTVFLQSFVEAGVDYFNALTRHFAHPEFEGSDLSYAGWIKTITGLPVISGGGVGLDASLFDSLSGKPANTTAHEGFDELVRRFDRGDFDLVSLGRTILTDPEWLIKVREGRYAELTQTLLPGDIFSGPPTNRPATEKTQSLPVRTS